MTTYWQYCTNTSFDVQHQTVVKDLRFIWPRTHRIWDDRSKKQRCLQMWKRTDDYWRTDSIEHDWSGLRHSRVCLARIQACCPECCAQQLRRGPCNSWLMRPAYLMFCFLVGLVFWEFLRCSEWFVEKVSEVADARFCCMSPCASSRRGGDGIVLWLFRAVYAWLLTCGSQYLP